jgi:preprotein translocase subunit SecA
MTKRGLRHEVLNAKQHFREAEIVAQAGQPGAVTVATNMAGRGVDILLGGNPEKLAEKRLPAEGLDPETEAGHEYYRDRTRLLGAHLQGRRRQGREAGGLYVLATERHESRRIDNQLRGRSGRQGDPGESRFYLSLEDDLMRIFATGAMSWVMDRALPEDVPIESKMVTKSVERAQNTVEQRNAEIRKNVLKYDEVLNEQRKVIYKRRQQILDRGTCGTTPSSSSVRSAEQLIGTHCVEELEDSGTSTCSHTELATFWPTELTADDLARADSRRRSHRASSPRKGRPATSAARPSIGTDVMRQIERQVMLRLIDQRWREHLHEMDHLREGINLRAMGQKDPLIEWQREGFDLFSTDDEVPRRRLRALRHARRAGGPTERPGGRRGRGAGGRQRHHLRSLRCRTGALGHGPTDRHRRDQGHRLGPVHSGPLGPPVRRGRCGRTGRALRLGEDAPQRALSVRQRQEVQALPRSLTRFHPARPTYLDDPCHG